MSSQALSENIPDPYIFVGLLYAGALGIGSLYAPQPLLAVIHTELNISASQASLLISLPLLALGLCPLFYGMLMAYISTRVVMTTSIILLATSGILLFFAPSFPALFAARAFQSLLFPALFTAIMTSISVQYAGAQLQRIMAMYIGVTILGGMFSRMLAGFLSSVTDWRTALLVISLAILPALFIVPRLKNSSSNLQRFELCAFSSILKSPGISTLLAMEWCTYFVFMGIANCLPFRLETIAEGMDEFGVGLMYTGYIAGILLAMYSRQVIIFFGNEIKALQYGFLIAFCALPTLLIPHTFALFLAMWIICTGQFLEHTINPGVINRLVTHHQCMVNGLYLSVYYTGGALGSYFPPLVQSYFGWEWAVALMTIVLLFGFFLSRHLNTNLIQNSTD